MHGSSAELQQIASALRRSSVEVTAVGRRLQYRAGVVVWHASAADAFRARMAARRVQAEALGRALEHAAALLDGHAAAVARGDWLTRTVRRLPWP